jgi:hypothetical protein
MILDFTTTSTYSILLRKIVERSQPVPYTGFLNLTDMWFFVGNNAHVILQNISSLRVLTLKLLT